MAIKRTSSNSISNAVKLSTGFASAAIPNSPTIGTATATSDVAATVTYTAAVLGATASTFTATSNPGSVTGTGSSPITVTGLTASTSYTFSVTAGNANGTSAASSASNSITTDAILGDFQSIATYTVGASPITTITFSSIPQTYKHLQIRVIHRDNRTSPAVNNFASNINGDTTASYSLHALVAATSVNNYGDPNSTQFDYIYQPTAASTANVFGSTIYDYLDYSSTTKNKTVRMTGGYADTSAGHLSMTSGALFKTDAITSLNFYPAGGSAQFVQYTQIALYGIKG